MLSWSYSDCVLELAEQQAIPTEDVMSPVRLHASKSPASHDGDNDDFDPDYVQLRADFQENEPDTKSDASSEAEDSTKKVLSPPVDPEEALAQVRAQLARLQTESNDDDSWLNENSHDSEKILRKQVNSLSEFEALHGSSPFDDATMASMDAMAILSSLLPTPPQSSAQSSGNIPRQQNTRQTSTAHWERVQDRPWRDPHQSVSSDTSDIWKHLEHLDTVSHQAEMQREDASQHDNPLFQPDEPMPTVAAFEREEETHDNENVAMFVGMGFDKDLTHRLLSFTQNNTEVRQRSRNRSSFIELGGHEFAFTMAATYGKRFPSFSYRSCGASGH